MYFLNPSESSLYDVIIMHELTINEQVALCFLKTHLLLFLLENVLFFLYLLCFFFSGTLYAKRRTLLPQCSRYLLEV